MLWAWGYSSMRGYKQEKGSYFERFFDKKKTIFLWLYPDKENRKFQLCLFFHPCKISLAFIFNVGISGIIFFSFSKRIPLFLPTFNVSQGLPALESMKTKNENTIVAKHVSCIPKYVSSLEKTQKHTPSSTSLTYSFQMQFYFAFSFHLWFPSSYCLLLGGRVKSPSLSLLKDKSDCL